ncbi:MAG: hypothetical protein ABH827_01450 [bacterium]
MKNKFLSSGLFITLCVCFAGLGNFSKIQAERWTLSGYLRKRKNNRISPAPAENIKTENRSTEKKEQAEQLLQKLATEKLDLETTKKYIQKILSEESSRRVHALGSFNALMEADNFSGILYLLDLPATFDFGSKISDLCHKKLNLSIKTLVDNNPKKLKQLIAFFTQSRKEGKLSQETYITILVSALLETAKNNKEINAFLKKTTTTLDTLYDEVSDSINKTFNNASALQEKLAHELWVAAKPTTSSSDLYQLKKLPTLLANVAIDMTKKESNDELKEFLEFVITSPVIHNFFYNIVHDAFIKTADNKRAIDFLCSTLYPMTQKNNMGNNGTNELFNMFVTILKDLSKKKDIQKLEIILESIVAHQIDKPILKLLEKAPFLNKKLIKKLKNAQAIREKQEKAAVEYFS